MDQHAECKEQPGARASSEGPSPVKITSAEKTDHVWTHPATPVQQQLPVISVPPHNRSLPPIRSSTRTEDDSFAKPGPPVRPGRTCNSAGYESVAPPPRTSHHHSHVKSHESDRLVIESSTHPMGHAVAITSSAISIPLHNECGSVVTNRVVKRKSAESAPDRDVASVPREQSRLSGGQSASFHCPLCVEVFLSFDSLKTHLLTKHPYRENILRLVETIYQNSPVTDKISGDTTTWTGSAGSLVSAGPSQPTHSPSAIPSSSYHQLPDQITATSSNSYPGFPDERAAMISNSYPELPGPSSSRNAALIQWSPKPRPTATVTTEGQTKVLANSEECLKILSSPESTKRRLISTSRRGSVEAPARLETPTTTAEPSSSTETAIFRPWQQDRDRDTQQNTPSPQSCTRCPAKLRLKRSPCSHIKEPRTEPQ